MRLIEVRAKDLYRALYVPSPPGSEPVYTGAGFAEHGGVGGKQQPEILKEVKEYVVLSLAKLKSAEEDPYPFYAAVVLCKRLKCLATEREPMPHPHFDFVVIFKGASTR
jgi:hypothetical protein